MATTSERTVIDGVTGEILESEIINTAPIEPEPDFVKLYVDAWCAFQNIKAVNTDFLRMLLPYMSYADDGQRIILAPMIKREIAAKCGWSEHTQLARCNNELSKLCKQGILKNIATNVYMVNPSLVGKGDWRKIKTLKASFDVIGEKAGDVSLYAEFAD